MVLRCSFGVRQGGRGHARLRVGSCICQRRKVVNLVGPSLLRANLQVFEGIIACKELAQGRLVCFVPHPIHPPSTKPPLHVLNKPSAQAPGPPPCFSDLTHIIKRVPLCQTDQSDYCRKRGQNFKSLQKAPLTTFCPFFTAVKG